MSQNDFNLANQGFPSMRSDMNSAFQALASNSSGATAPSTTYAYQWWYDTSTNILKMRNGSNSAWINTATFDQTNSQWLVVAKTGVNGSAAIPSGTTAQRDGSPSAGYIRFNSENSEFEGYDGTAWAAIGGGGGGAEAAAKSWLNYKSIVSLEILDSVGISSVTDDGVGRTLINFTTSFANTTYSLTSAYGADNPFNPYIYVVTGATGNNTVSTSGRVMTAYGSASENRVQVDTPNAHLAFFGDVA